MSHRLGTLSGTNRPGPLDSYPKTARDFCLFFIAAIAIASLVTATFYPALSKVERAYETNGRV